VDTLGLVLKALVHPANVQDHDGGRLLLAELTPAIDRFPRLDLIRADAGYNGAPLRDWVKYVLGVRLEVIQHPWTGARAPDLPPGKKPRGFQVLPWRWVIERTFAWVGRNRRLSKDYEFLPESEESWIYLAMTRLMIRRLAGS
jgi:putative transposase